MIGSEQLEARAAPDARGSEILSPEALAFVARLQRRFGDTRTALLRARAARQIEFDRGVLPDFLPDERGVRRGDWTVAPPPAALLDRRCEITGPVERKMMINALNSGATGFMADFEDSLAPTWANLIAGHANLIDALDRRLRLETPGKTYEVGTDPAVLMVRPRGWHLEEANVLVDGARMSASLFDVGMFAFHCAQRSLERLGGLFLYLPKMESHLEARLWNDVFEAIEEELGLPRGTIRATVLIENILAAFEMDEILYELRDHSAGLNAGRWDYIFSVIRKLRSRPDFVLPDRSAVAMTVPFMRAYTDLLVATCHRRGAHAMGGMAAFIPSRRDAEINANALAKVREDKQREARAGFDGTWVAHPDLVPVARGEFDAVLGDQPNQVANVPTVHVTAQQLLDVAATPGSITEAGVRTNIAVGVEYLAAWLGGLGAVALNNLMEDAATAEISRSQLWQWIHHGVTTDAGQSVTKAYVTGMMEEEVATLAASPDPPQRLNEARSLFETVVLDDEYTEFLTLPAYEQLDQGRYLTNA